MKFWQDVLRLAPTALQKTVILPSDPAVAFSREWAVVGPFQIGTREAAWSADPLEYRGGFRSLTPGNETFRSSLAPNGTVAWSQVTAKVHTSHTLGQWSESTAELFVDFADVDWSLQQQAQGWAGKQWQGWARGEILVSPDDRAVDVYVESILEFWINGTHYFGGDFFNFGRSPITLRLDPGRHTVDIRLIRDVRSMGGVGEPSLSVKMTVRRAANGLTVVSQGRADSPGRQMVLSDRITGPYDRLASSLASTTVHNSATSSIFVRDLLSLVPDCTAKLVLAAPIRLVPGQTRPVAFRLVCSRPLLDTHTRVPVNVTWSFEGEQVDHVLTINGTAASKSIQEPQKITFLHPGGVVSHAILRPPPPKNGSCGEHLPVLIALHGAGVDVEDDFWRHSFDPLPHLCAWVLFPTGGTLWSGDDWHRWGFADVEAAVAAIPTWIADMAWPGPDVDTNRWLVVGHSNGGQGTWYAVTHRPDKIIGAAELSGYSSIQNYVPYSLWHASDPARFAISQASLNTYNHPLLLDNAHGIPLMQQHGALDDNVPAYHSRLMSELISELGGNGTYHEVPGRSHYWDEVVTTTPLTEFYESVLELGQRPPRLETFSIASANPGDTGPKNGVQILELEVPGRIGRLHFSFDRYSLECTIDTRNVASFSINNAYRECEVLVIDGQAIAHVTDEQEFSYAGAQWHQTDILHLPPLPPRRGRQLGALDAILQTRGAFQIVVHSPAVSAVALQISRNLCQYFGADTDITADYDVATSSDANIVSVAIGADLPRGMDGYQYAIAIVNGHLQITDSSGRLRRWDRPTAAIYLRPLPSQRLELVVWGTNVDSVSLAARLVPMITGTGTPDFVVADDTMRWKGLEGTVALGFFGGDWSMSSNSFVE